MVLFTSGSLLTWGETSRCLAWHLPQVFACHLPLINYIPLSFTDITLWQSMPFSCKKQTSGAKIWLSYGGTSTFALCYIGFNFPVTPRQNCPPWMALKFGGGQKHHHNIAFLLVWGRGGGYRGQKLWSINHMGEPESGQGPLHGGSSWETDCLGFQWTQLGLHLGSVAWWHLPCATPQGGALGHPTSEWGRGNSLWADQPIWGLPTPCHRPPSHLPHRFEWVQWTNYNPLLELLASGISLTTGEPVYLENWYPAIPNGGAQTGRYPPLGKVSTIKIASPHKSTPLNEKERAAWPWR